MRYALRAGVPLLMVVSIALWALAPVAAQGYGDVGTLIAALDSRDAATRDAAVAELSLRGPGVLDALFGVMESRGSTNGQRGARAAAEHIVQQAAGWAPAGEAARVLIEQARTRNLVLTRKTAVDLLSFVASADDAPLVAGWLSDPELADGALFVLARIPDGGAVPVLSEHLKASAARKSPQAASIARALGETRHPSAAAPLASCLGADKTVALAALRALGRIPSTDAEPAVRGLLGSDDAELRAASRRAYLAMGEALVGAGETEAALPLFRQVMRIAATPEETCGALRGITACENHTV